MLVLGLGEGSKKTLASWRESETYIFMLYALTFAAFALVRALHPESRAHSPKRERPTLIISKGQR